MIDASLPQLPPVVPPTAAAGASAPVGPDFATLLAKGMPVAGEQPDAVPLDPPVAVTFPLPATVPFPEPVAFEAPGAEAVDHADRFDARGVLDATAVDAVPGRAVDAEQPRFADVGDAAPAGAVAGDVGGIAPMPARGLLRSSAAASAVLPARTDRVVIDQPLPTATPIAAMPPTQRITEREVALPAAARPRATPRATQGAPQVAVAALADGLAVAASVGALPDAERHRLRDAIAALLLRHGYHPRAVTLLAAPAPSRTVEFR